MKKKLTPTFALAIALVIFGGCRKPSANQPANGNSTSATEQAPLGGAAQTGQKYFFRGHIAGTLSIEMILVRDGDRLNGNYFYPKVGKNIALTGSVDKDGNVSMTEADESGKQTGAFKGKWKPAEDSPDPALSQIEGKWSKPDGTKETDFQVTQQPIELGDLIRVTPKVIKEANKEKLYEVEAEYPEIQGDARFDGFNREAKNLVQKDVAAFRTSETASDEDRNSDLPAETNTSSFDCGYDFRIATNDLISVEFAEGMYSRGAAHGNLVTEVLNYDVRNSKKLALGDLFIPKSKYLKTISDYCIKELKERAKKDDSMIFTDSLETSAGPEADNYRAWAITKKGLWITFDPYQVAAYAAGPQYVLVPYSALKDIIKPDGPIGNFAR